MKGRHIISLDYRGERKELKDEDKYCIHDEENVPTDIHSDT